MALIPENVQLIEIDAASIENEETVRADAADFFIDFENGRLTSQRITGTDAAIQWLKIGCLTEKDEYSIYGEFGTPHERLIEDQLPRDVTEGEITRGIEELAAQHERVESVDVKVNFTGNKSLARVVVNGTEESMVITR